MDYIATLLKGTAWSGLEGTLSRIVGGTDLPTPQAGCGWKQTEVRLRRVPRRPPDAEGIILYP